MTRKPLQAPTFSSRIGRDRAGKAVDALLKWIRSQPKHQKAQLLEHDEVIHLVVTMRKIPQKGRINPYYLPLPHALYSLPDASVCLFVDDRAKSPVQPSDAEARIRSESIPVTDVISLGSLKTDYIPYEARRKLCGSYDIFFADRRTIHLLPRLIGKQFFKKKKHPLPIDLSRKNWTGQMMRGCGSALLYMRTGTCCQLNVGRMSMVKDDIVDNIIAAVEGAVGKIPKGWANVRSVLIKSDESIGLPIYQALPEMGLKIDAFPKGEGNVVDSEGDVVAGHAPDNNPDNKMAAQGAEQVAKVAGAKKSASKKGRLHKVRYMDTNVGEENIMFDSTEDNKDDNDHHSLQPDDSKSDGKKGKNQKKRKQTDKELKEIFSDVSSFPEADGLIAEKSREKKKNVGMKKLKAQQVEDENTDELTEQRSQGKKKREGTKKLKTQLVEDGSADEKPEELIGEKSQGKKERKGKKNVKTQLVESGTVAEEPHSGIAKKSKSKVKKTSEIDSSPEDSALVIEKSSGRKMPDVKKNQKSQEVEVPEYAEEETFNMTSLASGSAKKRKGKIKKLESKQGTEKAKKSKV